MSSSQRPRNRELGKAIAALPETNSKPRIAKQGQYRYHDFVDKWFRTANGHIVVATTPNAPLLIFIVTGIFGVVSYHGFWHTAAQIIAIISIIIWGFLESRSGVNRFRRLLGKLALICTAITIILYFWD